jgi:hypothetical protein
MSRLWIPGMTLLMVLMLAGCNAPNRSSQPVRPSVPNATATGHPCPYAGAVVEVTYPLHSDLRQIRDVLVSLGWTQTSVGVDEVVNGTLDGASVSALVQSGHTQLSVHVLKSASEADYPDEDRKAESLLRRVKEPVEQSLGLPAVDTFTRRINRGCEG